MIYEQCSDWVRYVHMYICLYGSTFHHMKIIFLHVFPGHTVRHCGPHNMEKAHAVTGKGYGLGTSIKQ